MCGKYKKPDALGLGVWILTQLVDDPEMVFYALEVDYKIFKSEAVTSL